MSNYNNLKTSIDANIKQNGNQEITGPILNSVLNQMVNILGTGYQFAGVATIATNPGTPDAKVFYIANGKGTYEKFGSLEVTEDEVVVLYWDSAWHKVATGIASQAKLSELERAFGQEEFFEAGGINYLNGKDINDSKSIRSGYIHVYEDVTIDFSCNKVVPKCYIIKYLNGAYVGYIIINTNNKSSFSYSIIKDNSFDSIRIRANAISDWADEELASSSVLMYSNGAFINLKRGIVECKRYKIANCDNDFQFDSLLVSVLTAGLLRLYPNFNIPTDGAFISTDIDYVGIRTEPLKDEQLIKASVPYLYINGEKRGTIVLYDTDGTPFIYDKNGNKIIIQ